jgi:hypothetical protein
MEPFIVPARFCGPPDSGNGGYTCGMVARELGGVIECTLRSPVPLDAPLEFERLSAGGVVRRNGKVVLEANPTAIAVVLPAPIRIEAATSAMAASPAFDARHPFQTCFVCGPKREAHDGLRIFPSPVADELYAATWLPAAEFGDHRQNVKPEFLWAALDCPTGFAAGFPAIGKLVTGRLAVEQFQPITVNETCLLMSWPVGIEGRKHFSAACLYQHEKLRAVARATWIRLEA